MGCFCPYVFFYLKSIVFEHVGAGISSLRCNRVFSYCDIYIQQTNSLHKMNLTCTIFKQEEKQWFAQTAKGK